MSDKAIDDYFKQLMGEAAEEDTVKTAADGTVSVNGVDLSQEELGVLNEFLSEHEEDEKRAEEEKLAEESFIQGRIMARGFMAELDKVAAEGGYDTSTDVADPSTSQMAAGAAKGGVPNEDEEGSATEKQMKKEDGRKSPKSPTSSEDVVKVVKKVVQAANAASKGQDSQEVPNNLGVKEKATKGNKGEQPNNVA